MISPESRAERWALDVARQATKNTWAPAVYLLFGVLQLLLALLSPKSSLGAELCWVFAAAWTVLALLQFERLQFGRLLERQDLEARRIRPTSSRDAPAACDPA